MPSLPNNQLREHLDLNLHCLLYQVTSSPMTLSNMITWTYFGGAIRMSRASWASETSEIQELARLCQSNILNLSG